MREEVSSVCDQDNQTAFNLWEPPDIGEFQEESRGHTHNDADKHTAEEDEQEDAGTLEKAEEAIITRFALIVLLRSLEDDNSDSIVED